MEIEAKYTIAAEAQFEELLRAESFGPYTAGPLVIREVEDVYLDTADLRIMGGGFACRLRGQSPAGVTGPIDWTALLKGLGGAQGSLHQRTELEVALPQFEPDPAHWPAGEAREQALALTGGAPVRTLVALSQTRHVRLLHAGERLAAELSLDRVSIRAGAAPSGRIDLEVEAEAKGDGTVEDVRTLAGIFEADWGLTPQPLSKFERALAGIDAASTGVAPSDRLRPGDRPRLERIAATARPPQSRRARLLLAWADGADVRHLQESLGYSRSSVYFWIDAYSRTGLDVFPARVLASAEAPAAAVHAAPPAARRPRSMPRGPEVGSPPDFPVSEPDEVVAPAEPEIEPVPLAELLRRHQVDLPHAHHVADLAVRLFDLTADLHHLSAESRSLLEKAGVLHNLGLAADPARHHTVGRDLLLAAPVVGLTDLERQMIAAIIFLHRKRISPEKLEKKIVTALPAGRRREILTLAALVRVADGLDSSLSQTTHILRGQVSEAGVDVILSGPLAAEDAARAQVKADLWDLLQTAPFRFLSDAGQPLGGATDDVDAGADAPDSAGDSGERPAAPSLAAAELEPAEPQSPEAQAATPEPEPVAVSPLLDFVLSAVPTDAPGILPDEAAAEAGRKVLAFHLVRVLQHEPGARQGQDIEEVHDMRVAVRRLRSAFRVFGDAFRPAALAPFAKQLRRAGEALGAVRDLDVLSANARRYQAALPAGQSSALEPLLQAWATQRETARQCLIEYLNGDGYANFTATFAEFVTAPGEGARRADPALPEPYLVRHVAPPLIYTAFERVRAYEPLLVEPYLELLHALRIEGKRLRYTLEFLREVLGPEAALVIAETTALQDHLGSLHDADVAELLLRNFLNGTLAPGSKGAPRPRVLAPGVASYLAARQIELQDLLLGFPAAWARFNRPEVRQSLALAVSVL